MTLNKLSPTIANQYSMEKILLEEDSNLNSPSPSTAETLEKRGCNGYLSMDCEFVGAGPYGDVDLLGRVSIVNYYGIVVLDEFVKPAGHVTDWRTRFSGVTASAVQHARSYEEVKSDVLRILQGSIIVGHDLYCDLKCFGILNTPDRRRRDTVQHGPFRALNYGRKAALRHVARVVLCKTIQCGAHSSVEDARAAMLAFRLNRKYFKFE